MARIHRSGGGINPPLPLFLFDWTPPASDSEPPAASSIEESSLELFDLAREFELAREADLRPGVDGVYPNRPPRGFTLQTWITAEAWWKWPGNLYLRDTAGCVRVVGPSDWLHDHLCPECRHGYTCQENCKAIPWDMQEPCGDCQVAALNRSLFGHLPGGSEQ
ncbi:MAG: hypothetical protein ACREDR_00125 [Blastocatellia bacterium]